MRDPFSVASNSRFSARRGKVSIELSIRHLRHKRLSESQRPPMIVVFKNGSVGVAAVFAVIVVRPSLSTVQLRNCR